MGCKFWKLSNFAGTNPQTVVFLLFRQRIGMRLASYTPICNSVRNHSRLYSDKLALPHPGRVEASSDCNSTLCMEALPPVCISLPIYLNLSGGYLSHFENPWIILSQVKQFSSNYYTKIIVKGIHGECTLCFSHSFILIWRSKHRCS